MRVDVSEVLSDPDFVTRGLVCTRTERTLVKGRAVDGVPTETEFAGVVVPDDGKTFERKPDETRGTDAVLIYTKFALRPFDEATEADADTVTHPDSTAYTVKRAQPYKFGHGFTVALCEVQVCR